ncbi:MAG: DUF2807 domain-containing protein [Saprospiraceae bacterium]|nr:DUF2807 domain-containing protein [Saprospiraceae bacterium]
MIDVLRKIIKPIAFIIGIMLVAWLALIWLAAVGGLFWGLPFSSFLLPETPFLTTMGVINILVFIGIPILMLILTVMRIFMRTHFKPRWAVGLWVFWLVNLVSLMFVGMSTIKEFSTGGTSNVGSNILQPGADTLFIEMDNSQYDNVLFRMGDELAMSGDKLIDGDINLRIEKAEGGKYELIQSHASRGSSMEETEQLANAIDYQYKMEGNRLVLPSNFIIPRGEKWRGQKVNFTLKVPVGKWVKVNENARRIVRDIEQDASHRFPWWHEDYFWQMGPEGMVAPAYVEASQKDYSYRDFSKIRVEGGVKLNIRQGNDYRVLLDRSEDYEGEVEVSQSGDRLSISTASSTDEPVVFEITMPGIQELWAINSGDISLYDFNLGQLRIVNEGEAQIKAFVEVDNLTAELTGDNELDLRGKGKTLRAILSDDARLDAEHFTVGTADMHVMNNSWAKVSATDTLRQVVEEGSELVSKRSPVVINQ